MDKMIGMAVLTFVFVIIYNLSRKGVTKIKVKIEDSKLVETPEDVNLIYKSAKRSVDLLKIDEAITKLNNLLILEPEHTGANLFLALSYCSKKDFDKAYDIFSAELKPDKIKSALRMKQFSSLDEANFYYLYGYCLSLKGIVEEFKKYKNLAVDLAYVNGDKSLEKSKLY